MSVVRMGAQTLLSVSLVAIYVPFVMAQLDFAPLTSPTVLKAGDSTASEPMSGAPPPMSGAPPPVSGAPPPMSRVPPPLSANKGSVGAIVGGVFGGVAAAILIVLVVLWYCLKKRREDGGLPKTAKMAEQTTTTATTANPRTPPGPPGFGFEGLKESVSSPRATTQAPPAYPALVVKELNVAPQPAEVGYNMDVRKYNFAEVEAISSNWAYKLGEGGFGTVYYGEIFRDTAPNAESQKVALKRLSATSQQGKNEFLNEVRLLSRIHYRYLVPLLGFCDDTNNQVLIYEYVQEGTIADWLHGAQQGHPDFSWHNRLIIAHHAALGLEYLHVGARPNIIHRDVKSSNILITKDWEGRVADFGLSKSNIIGDKDQQRTHMTTLVKGTPGYLDPEYFRTAKLTTKSDVYSFGIVLLELVTGRLPIVYSEEDPELRCIQNYVEIHYPHNLAAIADPNLKGNYDMDSMHKIVRVALRSLALQGTNRPTMSEVVGEVRNAMTRMQEQGWATSNSPDILSDILAGTDTGGSKVRWTPSSFEQGRRRSGSRSTRSSNRSSTSVSHSTGSSSATSIPSQVAFPR